jgi:hypothetical protein
MKWRHVLAGLSAAVVASPIQADWQYTRWGMTPNQINEASSGNASQIPPREGSRTINGEMLAHGSYVSGPYKFGVDFFFNELGLSQVTLHPVSKEHCATIVRDLTGKYGDPVSVTKLPMQVLSLVWRDVTPNNEIRFNAEGSVDCSIVYTPIRPMLTKGADGL